MIIVRRASDQKEVTRNSSYFKKLPNLPGSTIPADLQVSIDFEGPAVCQPAQPQHPKRNLVRHTQAKLMVTKTTQRLQQSNLPLHRPYPSAEVD